MFKISIWLEKLYAIIFQGNPVRIVPLMNSIIPNIKEKKKKELKFFFGFKIKNKKEAKP